LAYLSALRKAHLVLIELIVAAIKRLLKGFFLRRGTTDRKKSRLHVAMIAYDCWPFWGSEPEVGWRWALEAARAARVHVITRKESRKHITEFVRRYGPVPGVDFVFKDFPLFSKLVRGTRFNRLHYILWQLLAVKAVFEINRSDRIDIVHHTTFVNVWIPALAMLLPFGAVWGPAGANLGLPKQFRKKMCLSVGEKISDWLRKIVILKLSPVNPLLLMALAGADQIILISRELMSIIPDRYHRKVRISTANGVDASATNARRCCPETPTVVYVGRLLNFKGSSIAIRAFEGFARTCRSNARLTIITGQNFRKTATPVPLAGGSENLHEQRSAADPHAVRHLQESLRYVAAHLSNYDVEILGAVPRARVFAELEKASVLLYPSFEQGGVVVLEALSKGTPVVCMNTGGPGQYVDRTCGIKIEPGDYKQTVERLAKALETLCCDAELWTTLSKGAIKRVNENFLWSYKGRLLAKCYAQLMGQTGSCPSAHAVHCSA